ncbi:TIR domain-containing protein [Sorangium sp. So ce145]|uniref:TIR domain-containing protein n=1 Tax=Sorangium sp. So ce145 TaxID=3133285 RepID=UPI003F5F24EE
MDDILDDLVRLARRCERAANTLDAEPIASMCARLRTAADSVGRAASGGWLGYHANIYIEDLRPKTARDYFDTEWGSEGAYSNQTQGGPWVIYEYEPLLEEIKRRAQVDDTSVIERTAEAVGEVFTECRDELLPTIDALLSTKPDEAIKKVRGKVSSLKPYHTEMEFFQALVSGKQFMSRDARATSGGIQAPPHVKVGLWLTSQLSYRNSAQELAKHARYIAKYLEKTRKMKGKTVAKTDGKIFIGHGRSRVWKDLKDFLQDRLGLTWDEFNREATAGVSAKERLETMLDEACFAFIVMTAEDEQADKTKHARANVIHEVGLFQGRLGFKRAIVLLEQGCEEFSNITGLGQIRFPPGDIASKFEEIRLVLEREKLV